MEKPKANYKGFNVRYKKTLQEKFEKGKWRQHYDENGNCLGCGKHYTKHTVSERAKGSMHEASKRTEDIVWCNPSGKNPGDIFFINPKPFGLICMDCPITRSKIKTVKNNVGDVIDQYCQTCGKRNLSSHFASYPPELPLQILKCACPPDGIVLDPFLGAGTTSVAAEQLGLQWIGIELKQEYIDIARKRLNPFFE